MVSKVTRENVENPHRDPIAQRKDTVPIDLTQLSRLDSLSRDTTSLSLVSTSRFSTLVSRLHTRQLLLGFVVTETFLDTSVSVLLLSSRSQSLVGENLSSSSSRSIRHRR